LILVCAGALAAAGKLGVLPVLGITVVACVLADWIWFEAGRRRGDKILHFLHRLTTRDPEFHDRRAKRIFARYGPPLLLVSKFVPGLDAVAPPLAGTSRTSRVRFLAFDAVGAGLYACVYGGLGYAFSHNLDRAAAYVSRAGRLFLGLALLGICIFVAYQLFRRVRCVRMSHLDPVECGNPAKMPSEIPRGLQNGD
jgi:membrane protein DedA with SNARE-associated domain